MKVGGGPFFIVFDSFWGGACLAVSSKTIIVIKYMILLNITARVLW